MIKRNKKIIASILFVFISFVCVGQVIDGNPPPPIPPPPGLPIEGPLLIVLAVLGLFYGVKKKV